MAGVRGNSNVNILKISIKFNNPNFVMTDIPHTMSCKGYNVSDPFIIQLVGQSCFFVDTTPLKLLNRISQNFVVDQDILWRRAYSHKILIQLQQFCATCVKPDQDKLQKSCSIQYLLTVSVQMVQKMWQLFIDYVFQLITE